MRMVARTASRDWNSAGWFPKYRRYQTQLHTYAPPDEWVSKIVEMTASYDGQLAGQAPLPTLRLQLYKLM